MDKSLILRNIKISLGNEELLSINKEVKCGEIFTLMGPSGSGKTSLLNLIGGFLAHSFSFEGDVLLDGTNVLNLPPHKRQIGTLFQDALLFPHMSVGTNIVFGAKSNQKEKRALAEHYLQRVDLEGYFDRDPATLSGGQRARAALARLLISEPKALLLDEPFSKLDANLRHAIRELVFSLAKAQSLPTILVTHDQQDADFADGEVLQLLTR